MSDLYTEEIVDHIMRAKSKMPSGWIIETEDHWGYGAGIVLLISNERLSKFSIHDKIRIAEVTNELCMRIQATGIPCGVEKY